MTGGSEVIIVMSPRTTFLQWAGAFGVQKLMTYNALCGTITSYDYATETMLQTDGFYI